MNLRRRQKGLVLRPKIRHQEQTPVKENISFKCRMCGSHDDTVQHILGNCPKLRQTAYKKRLLGGSYIEMRARNMDLSSMTK